MQRYGRHRCIFLGMRPEDFRAPHIGRAKRGVGRWGFWYFSPEPIPRTLDLATETVLALSNADTALGRLAGAGRLLRDPHLLVRPIERLGRFGRGGRQFWVAPEVFNVLSRPRASSR